MTQDFSPITDSLSGKDKSVVEDLLNVFCREYKIGCTPRRQDELIGVFCDGNSFIDLSNFKLKHRMSLGTYQLTSYKFTPMLRHKPLDGWAFVWGKPVFSLIGELDFEYFTCPSYTSRILLRGSFLMSQTEEEVDETNRILTYMKWLG